jgi:hypothetical protein
MHKECLITIRDFDSEHHVAVVEYMGERFRIDLAEFSGASTYEEFREKLLKQLSKRLWEEAYWRAYGRSMVRDWGKLIEGIHDTPRFWINPDPCGRDY